MAGCAIVVLVLVMSGAPSVGRADTVEPLRLDLAEAARLGVARSLQLASEALTRDEARLAEAGARQLIIPTVALSAAWPDGTAAGGEYALSVATTRRDGLRLGAAVERSRAAGAEGRKVTFSLTRPLLRNFGRHVTGRAIDLAKLDGEMAVELFKAELDLFIRDLARNYLGLWLARKNLAIQEQAHQRALEQYRDTAHDIERGVLAGREIYLVEENVVRFDIKRREAERDIAAYELALNARFEHPVTAARRLEPTEELQRFHVGLPSFAEALPLALATNPTLRVRRLAVEKAEIDAAYVRNQVLPLLDLFVEHTLDDSSPMVADDETTVGLAFKVPLSRRAVRADATRARLRMQRDEAERGAAETTTSYELRRLYVDVAHRREVLTLLERATGLSQKKLAAEREKYRNGLSTLADVVRFQQELESSMLAETRTLVALNELVLDTYVAEGVLHERMGIRLE